MIATIGSALIIAKIADNILGGKNATTNSAIPITISKISGIDVDSVFWELDPANNQIKYNVVTETQYSGTASVQGVVGTTNANACKNYVSMLQKNRPDYKYLYDSVSSLSHLESDIYTFDCKYSVDFDPNDEYASYLTSVQGTIRNPVQLEIGRAHV